MDRQACAEAGRLAALTDWQGGYRTEPTREVAEGVVRALVGRDALMVEFAANSYMKRFLELLIQGGDRRPTPPPRQRYRRDPYPW